MRSSSCSFVVMLIALSLVGQVFAFDGDEDTYCGVRVARFMLDYHGQPATFEDLTQEMKGVSTKGVVSVQQIVDTLQAHQLLSVAVKVRSLSELSGYCPGIIHISRPGTDTGHFVVLTKIDGKFATTWDGLQGVQVFPVDQLDMQFSGHAIVITEKLSGGGIDRKERAQRWGLSLFGGVVCLVSSIYLFRGFGSKKYRSTMTNSLLVTSQE